MKKRPRLSASEAADGRGDSGGEEGFLLPVKRKGDDRGGEVALRGLEGEEAGSRASCVESYCGPAMVCGGGAEVVEEEEGLEGGIVESGGRRRLSWLGSGAEFVEVVAGGVVVVVKGGFDQSETAEVRGTSV